MYIHLLLKYQTFVIPLVKTACIFLNFFSYCANINGMYSMQNQFIKFYISIIYIKIMETFQ